MSPQQPGHDAMRRVRWNSWFAAHSTRRGTGGGTDRGTDGGTNVNIAGGSIGAIQTTVPNLAGRVRTGGRGGQGVTDGLDRVDLRAAACDR